MQEELNYQHKVSIKEWIFLITLILIYSVVAFWKLGDRVAPESYYQITNSTNPAVFEVNEAPAFVNVYAPVNDSSKYIGISIYGSVDGRTWTKVFDTDDDQTDYTAAMIWYHYPLSTSSDMRYIKIDKHPMSNRLVLSEVAFQSTNGTFVQAKATTKDTGVLLDEPETVCTNKTRMNSAYFDESYFPSSALEMQDGLSVAEMDHPAVGRLIIGIGMSIWGRNPFGFRFMQVCFGIMMIPLLYFFGKILFKSSIWAGVASVLLCVDFMHYTQTRIGTLDAFLTFFILAMFAFLYFYHNAKSLRWRMIFLLLSGIMTGLAIGTKWSGCYAALGLAILYFYWMIRDLRGKEKKQKKRYRKECLWCVLTFICVPIAIYIISYIPYANTIPNQGLFETIIKHSQAMLSYHTGSATNYHHPYSSHWWTWFLALKPVFYYYEASTNIRIYASGNPMVWGMGLLGVLFALENGIAKDDDSGIVISVSYLLQLIPWFFVTRDTFLYHYFPMVPFLVLGVCYFFKSTCNHVVTYLYKKCFVSLFIIFSICMFIVAFPFIYGLPMMWETLENIRFIFLMIGIIVMLLYLMLCVWDSMLVRKDHLQEKISNERKESAHLD